MSQPRTLALRLGPAAIVLATCACGSPTGVEPVETYLAYESEHGEWVGQGGEGRITLADGPWIARFYPHTASRTQERIEVSAPGWSMLFASADGASLVVGPYENAQRSLDRTQPVLDVGSGRGCNVTSGRFEVLFIETGAGNELNKLRLRFTQHCEGATAALRGELSVVANPWR